MKLSTVSTSQNGIKGILEVLLTGFEVVFSDELRVVFCYIPVVNVSAL